MPRRLLLAVAVVLILLGARPAAAYGLSPEVAHAVLSLGVQHYTIHGGDPRNAINIVVIDSGAPVEFKAVMVASDTGRAVPHTTSELCRRWRCLVGVNGDMFGSKRQPLGAVVSDAEVLVPMSLSPVPAHWQLSLSANGQFSIDVAPAPGARQSTGTSYPLLVGSQPQLISERSAFTLGRHPRTFIGWNPSGQKIIVTVDGRSARSRGLSLAEGTALMLALGATDAVNMDGGGSTTFVVNGRVVNRPSDGRERAVANAWLVVATSSPPSVAMVSQEPDALPAVLDLRQAATRPPKPFWVALAVLLMVSVLHGCYLRSDARGTT